MSPDDLEWLLALDGASFEMSAGYVVEFTVKRTAPTPQQPQGISYALVFRPLSGPPIVRFDNAHAPARRGRMRGRDVRFDHWHRMAGDSGRPYRFETAAKLVDDFWREVKRAMDEKGIPHDL